MTSAKGLAQSGGRHREEREREGGTLGAVESVAMSEYYRGLLGHLQGALATPVKKCNCQKVGNKKEMNERKRRRRRRRCLFALIANGIF